MTGRSARTQCEEPLASGIIRQEMEPYVRQRAGADSSKSQRQLDNRPHRKIADDSSYPTEDCKYKASSKPGQHGYLNVRQRGAATRIWGQEINCEYVGLDSAGIFVRRACGLGNIYLRDPQGKRDNLCCDLRNSERGVPAGLGKMPTAADRARRPKLRPGGAIKPSRNCLRDLSRPIPHWQLQEAGFRVSRQRFIAPSEEPSTQ